MKNQEIPKPNFSDLAGASPLKKRALDLCPPEISVSSPNFVRSAENSPHLSRCPNLSPGDKKSLKTFLSLVSAFNNSAERLFGFCEHVFKNEVAQLAIDQLDKHIVEFKELQVRISSQNQFVEDLQRSKVPSPVSFSISTWRNLSSEDWPISTSDDWVSVAASHLKVTPPEFSNSLKRDTPSLEERLAMADKKRKRIENIRNREIRMKTNKVRRAKERRVQQQEEAISTFNEKQDNATQRREAHINQIKEKAHSEIEKIQETRFMQELENEDRKLKMERKMSKVAKKYDDMVRDRREKAKERSSIKSPSASEKNSNTNLYSNSKTKKRSLSLKETSVIDAILHGELPGGDLLDIGDEFSDSIPAIELPEFPEVEPNPSATMKNLISKMSHDDSSSNSQLAICYLKAVQEQKTTLKWNSEEGQLVRETLQNMIYTNLPNTNQLIHYVVGMVHSSYPFALHVAFECISSFRQLCYRQDSLSMVNELLTLWKALLSPGCEDEPKSLLIAHLARHGVLMKLCFVLEASNTSDLRNDSLKQLSYSILNLIESMVLFYHTHATSLANSDFSAFFERAAFDCIISALVSFLTNCSNDFKMVSPDSIILAIRSYSMIIVHYKNSLPAFLDKSNVKSLLSIFDAFFKPQPPQHSPQRSPSSPHSPQQQPDSRILNELIVLIGLAASASPLVKESSLSKSNVLKTLCSMPLSHFIQPNDSIILIPTIIACCIDNEENTEFVKKNINGSFIINFIEGIKDDGNEIFSPKYRIDSTKIEQIVHSFTPA